MGPGRLQSGFTLLEAIVTLVIVSLIVATLMQALGQTLDMRMRLIRYQGESRRAALEEAWFRDSIGGAVADREEALGGFEGTPDRFDMLTASPLVGEGLVRIQWSLEQVPQGRSLGYRDATRGSMPIIEGPLRDAAFSYLDQGGEWHDRWEPSPEQAMPRAVRFRAESQAGALVWIVPIVARPVPLENPRFEDVIGGL